MIGGWVLQKSTCIRQRALDFASPPVPSARPQGVSDTVETFDSSAQQVVVIFIRERLAVTAR
jgi:hypothetical protein